MREQATGRDLKATMNALCNVLLLSLGLLIGMPALADTGFLDRSVTLKGRTYAYQVYVPANYSPAKTWPVIVYLHGNLHQGQDGMRQTNAAFADAVRENRPRFPAIVVVPQAPTGSWWFASEMQDLVVAELDHTIAEFHGDPARVYLTGFSMGATGTYRLAYHHPGLFAALVVVAGRIEPGPSYTAEEIQSDRKANAFLNRPDPFMALAASLKKVPIWVFHGSDDETVSVEQSRRLVAALKDAGADVKYTEYPGVNHVEALQKVYFDPALLQWMLQQHRPISP
jgi:predicted peptidase